MGNDTERSASKPEAAIAHRCATRVYDGSFSGYPCSKPAKVERNGVWYCGTHDPVRIKEKHAARTAKWDAERAVRREEERAAKEQKSALERNAARYLWLRDPENAGHPAWDQIIDSECPHEEMDAAIDAAMKGAA